jgi:hypothetical protein
MLVRKSDRYLQANEAPHFGNREDGWGRISLGARLSGERRLTDLSGWLVYSFHRFHD